MDNTIILFFRELIVRFGAKSPKFFKTLRTILLVATIITGVPQLLIYFDVTLPASIAFFASKVVSIATFVSMVLTNLPVIDSNDDNSKSFVTGKKLNNQVFLPYSKKYAIK